MLSLLAASITTQGVTSTHIHNPFSNRQLALAAKGKTVGGDEQTKSDREFKRGKTEQQSRWATSSDSVSKKPVAKWMPSGPAGEAICVKRGKDAVMLSGRPVGEHSQRQTGDGTCSCINLCVSFFISYNRNCNSVGFVSSQHVK